ncbi:hypothetical protein K0M31_005434 [Melipona bicolor]|uniref:Uncharacterized protein n=1 Tax=Melipona bicolor TaxID=60889 RepID=A0AA40KMJ1_9HYME|nr:hypothetical protein K0M31_005434 [Melipona bicolor]
MNLRNTDPENEPSERSRDFEGRPFVIETRSVSNGDDWPRDIKFRCSKQGQGTKDGGEF